MVRILGSTLLLFICFVVNSCINTDVRRQDDELILTNKELRKEIVNYSSLIKQYNVNFSYTYHVFYKQINDSIDKFEITIFANGKEFLDYPYLFKIKIGKDDVFFHYGSYYNTTTPKKHYFAITENSYKNILKKYYPKELKEYQANYGKPIKAVCESGFDGPIVVLTFTNGRLNNRKMHGFVVK